MAAKPIPNQTVPVVIAGGLINPIWYEYFKSEQVARQAISLSTLPDVALTGLANGEVLIWNSAASKWKNETVVLSSLSDVQLTALADGEVLIWNAADSKWENGVN